MSIKKLLPAGAAALAAVFTAVMLAPAQAAVQPYVEGGNIYRARNVTKNTDFTDPATADKCETLQYRVRIHNPGPDAELENVTVKAVIPPAATTQNVSTVTVSATNASPSSRSDTATVNLASALKVSYIPGSSQLLDSNGGVISGIGDVTSGAGVNIGKVGISVDKKRFVQFKAKTDCPKPPEEEPEKKFKCVALNYKTIDRSKYKLTAVASVQNVTVQSYTFTVTRGGNTVDQKTVTTNALTADYDFNQPTPGTYLVTAVVKTNHGSTNPNDCAKQITVPEDGKPPVPPVTPTTPVTPDTPSSPSSSSLSSSSSTSSPGAGAAVLPETGPADTAAMVLAVTAVSSTAYYIVSRRLGQM